MDVHSHKVVVASSFSGLTRQTKAEELVVSVTVLRTLVVVVLILEIVHFFHLSPTGKSCFKYTEMLCCKHFMRGKLFVGKISGTLMLFSINR